MKEFLLVVAFFLIFGLYIFRFDKKPDCLLINDVQFFDGVDLILKKNKDILISNGLINGIEDTHIGKFRNLNCSLIQGSHLFLMPGLIDSHTHLLAYDKHSVRSWKEAMEFSAKETETSRLSQAEENAKSMLQHGFTTVRDLGNSGHFLDERFNDLSRQSALYPRMIYSGPPLAVAPSQIDLPKGSQEYLIIQDDSDFSHLFINYKMHGAEWVKVYVDNSRGKENLISKNLLEKIIEKAHSENLKVALHAEYLESVVLGLKTKADSIEHVYETPTKFSKEFGRPYVVLTELPKKTCLQLEKNAFDQAHCDQVQTLQNRRFNWLVTNQFSLVFGSDALLDFTSKYKNRGEASLSSLLSWKSSGLSSFQILKSATSTAAQMLSLDAGEIKIGYKADMVIVRENPLENIDTLLSPVSVIHSGQIFCSQKDHGCNDANN